MHLQNDALFNSQTLPKRRAVPCIIFSDIILNTKKPKECHAANIETAWLAAYTFSSLTYFLSSHLETVIGNLRLSRGGLAVSTSTYETTGPGSILGVAIFPG